MVTRHHPDHYFVPDFVTTSGTATYQSDLVTGATRTRNWRQPMTSPDIDDGTTYNDHDRRFRQQTTSEKTNLYEHLLDARTTLPIQVQANVPRLS